MHGGATGVGAPHGNRNALKTGAHTAAAKAERRRLSAFIREAEALLRALEG